MAHEVLVLAHGSARRWGGFLGAPKQFVVVDGETLIGRICRQFAAAGCKVTIVGPDGLPWPEGVRQVELPEPHLTGTEQDKLFATCKLWSKKSRTIILWGDCFYSEAAVESIVTHDSDDLHYWRRSGPSSVTGHRWDESFALSFGPQDHQRVIDAAFVVLELWVRGKVKRDHMFMHYAAALGLPNPADVTAVVDTPGQTLIDDWTDDFDSPAEWVGWIGRYYKGKVPVIVAGAYRAADEWRRRSQALVDGVYQAMGVRASWADAGGEPFSIAASRNLAVSRAAVNRPGWRVAMIVDSDTLVPEEQFWAAAYLADLTGHFVIAYEDHYRLSERDTRKLLVDGADPLRVARETAGVAATGTKTGNACHGVVAVPRALWEQSGGYDERFKGWGGEDRAFWLTCGALSGEPLGLRIPGGSWHYWHPRPATENPRHPQRQANRDLAIKYKTAAGVLPAAGILPETHDAPGTPDMNALRAILTEPGAPLGSPAPAAAQATLGIVIQDALIEAGLNVVTGRHLGGRTTGVRSVDVALTGTDPSQDGVRDLEAVVKPSKAAFYVQRNGKLWVLADGPLTADRDTAVVFVAAQGQHDVNQHQQAVLATLLDVLHAAYGLGAGAQPEPAVEVVADEGDDIPDEPEWELPHEPF